MARLTIRLLYAFFFLAITQQYSHAQVARVNIAPEDATNHFDPRNTLGAGIDRIATVGIDKMLTKPILDQVFTAGWQPVSYRLNTELSQEAWHWNPKGTWSLADERGYFVGSTDLKTAINHSDGFKSPRGSSSLTDGNISTYWKSNPYLSARFTGEADTLHPQWVMLDLTTTQQIDSIKVAWAVPFATKFSVQFWTSPLDPVDSPTAGVWEAFPKGVVESGKGGVETIRLADRSMAVRFIRILMTHSSDTCNEDGPSDPRNCVGYAIKELYLGTTTEDGEFHDVLQHVADPERTRVRASSVDPWHTSEDHGLSASSQVGFDLFYTSGVTQGLPAMMPIALILCSALSGICGSFASL